MATAAKLSFSWRDVEGLPEPKVLPGMLEELFARAPPEMAGRCADFSANRAVDNAARRKQLQDRWAIRPLIDTRLMWQVEKEEAEGAIVP